MARHRSFRRAGAELQISPSALSENLRELEERLGVRLLNRTTRSVAPTEAGVIRAGRLESLLDAWFPPFPGPFLYYPSRRQAPPALAAFVNFANEIRRREAESRAQLPGS